MSEEFKVKLIGISVGLCLTFVAYKTEIWALKKWPKLDKTREPSALEVAIADNISALIIKILLLLFICYFVIRPIMEALQNIAIPIRIVN